MSDQQRVLDLDDLLGQASSIKVKWNGREYELLRMESVSPKQAVKFQKLQARANRLQTNGESTEEADAVELENVMDEMLGMLCKDLPLTEIPFGMKMRIVTFYGEQAQGKKKEIVQSAPIGAMSPPASDSGTG